MLSEEAKRLLRENQKPLYGLSWHEHLKVWHNKLDNPNSRKEWETEEFLSQNIKIYEEIVSYLIDWKGIKAGNNKRETTTILK